MKESYGEGVATHTGPESCVAVREGGGEALTGVRAGRVLSREIMIDFGVPTLSEKRKATPGAPPSRGAPGPRAVGDPVHVRKHLAREPGDPAIGPGEMAPGSAPGSPREHDGDERPREVGQARSTGEAPEQRPRCAAAGGGGGGKGPGQGEPETSKTGPGHRAGSDLQQCAGPGTAGSADGTRRCGSPRSGTTSTTSTDSGRPTSASSARAAPGVDGVTWQALRRGPGGATSRTSPARLQRGAYRAKPVRRVYIPKADGRQRPLGVPALEDKIVQRATVEVLNAIYEVDFLGFLLRVPAGAQPAQCAGRAVRSGSRRRKVNWVLDADIRGFFDAIDHEWLVKFVEHRIADQRVVRLVKKWLNAGVLEDGERDRSGGGDAAGRQCQPAAWRISTSTTCSTSGSSSGGGRRRAAT